MCEFGIFFLRGRNDDVVQVSGNLPQDGHDKVGSGGYAQASMT